MFDIGVPETSDFSVAYGTNDLFQVVGRGRNRGLCWDSIQGWLGLTSLVTNLDDFGCLRIEAATDISNRGQITGYAILADGESKHALILTPVLSVPESVTIDIKPGSDPNSINPKSKEVIPVAVLGSIDFDAMQVDFSTVTFGPGRASPAHHGHVKDVNDDGFMDMVFHFKTQEMGIACANTEATLNGEIFDDGEIFDGTLITGTDTVNTVGCK